jgi:hypothetical protein
MSMTAAVQEPIRSTAFYGWLIGINAEGKSREDITKPLAASDA